jgi:hypothetical protein
LNLELGIAIFLFKKRFMKLPGIGRGKNLEMGCINFKSEIGIENMPG